ncbi:ATP-dependent sacrificial sulfur transferase LarE [Schaalia hyovaginalis]|uniref:ATP-dependent sacrificial sulfur transferase LarE n=1 Tax=Schaalia hyovaginalis TaxID=29316 RepID=UPI0012B37A50|nr:ATP-dependent sacrificial sulfur transferase LarE [Schaalia hyovaginalis]MST63235.1 ATP-dependent sacrificial sulfur transferase LarE [Schaalia hyovaginalis]
MTAATLQIDSPLSAASSALADAVAASLKRRGVTKIGVAYSGGVDSSVLAALAARALGKKSVILLLAVSPSLARRQYRFAKAQADFLGLELVEIPTFELDDPQYRTNQVDRCYFCKAELAERFENEAVRIMGLDAIAIGTNADDLIALDRPGQRAADERGILSPLAEAKATKADVRMIAKELALPSAEAPASPCLASRIPHGTPVSAQALARIDAAEEAVLDFGFSDCRVRDHGEIARVEVPAAELTRLSDPATVAGLNSAIRHAGYRYATVDLAGIQSGAFTLEILAKRGNGR